ncbi:MULTISPECIES: tyrosine-type recombinase/integrase [unclassified Mesorhizobium]|uniref:tyrosine-type recombinase/integrase n=1 Tax=unclassified Mesorhizobium TaxID=325217 RepID=UPI00112AB852|nr:MULTISPECIES: tyrosine-type recombinase/integrase [unclassified Mesorhizobium]TPJ86911.1 integrase [Mesorhizobium sp. B2-5-12]TPK19134.1 integrase [Mesorhizobium sp. B2-5-6]
MSEFKLTQRPGSANWYIRGTDSAGREIFRSTKTKDKATAKALLVKFQARVLTESVHGKVATTTFEEAARAYLKDGGDGTYIIRANKDGVQSGLLPHFGDTLLKNITQDDLDKAAVALCRPGAGRETLIRNVYTPFIAIWNFAASEVRKMAIPKKWQRPRKPKGTNVVRFKEKRSGTKPVDYERAAKFVAAMSPAPAMVMTALFYTGLRPIELFALSANDIDVKRRWGVVQSSKTGEPRGFPLHWFLCEWLGALVERGGALFRTPRGEPYEQVIKPEDDEGGGGGLKSAIQGARRRSGILDISPYTARHTVSTGLVVAGVHPHIKDQILGHAVDDMSRRYTNVPQAPLIEAIDKLPVPTVFGGLPWVADPIAFSAMLPRRATGGREQEIISLRTDGMSLKQIVDVTGVSEGSVFAVLRKAGMTGTNAAKGKRRKVDETALPIDSSAKQNANKLHG